MHSAGNTETGEKKKKKKGEVLGCRACLHISRSPLTSIRSKLTVLSTRSFSVSRSYTEKVWTLLNFLILEVV